MAVNEADFNDPVSSRTALAFSVDPNFHFWLDPADLPVMPPQFSAQSECGQNTA
jgi:hypothetical protein